MSIELEKAFIDDCRKALTRKKKGTAQVLKKYIKHTVIFNLFLIGVLLGSTMLFKLAYPHSSIMILCTLEVIACIAFMFLDIIECKELSTYKYYRSLSLEEFKEEYIVEVTKLAERKRELEYNSLSARCERVEVKPVNEDILKYFGAIDGKNVYVGNNSVIDLSRFATT